MDLPRLIRPQQAEPPSSWPWCDADTLGLCTGTVLAVVAVFALLLATVLL